MNACSNPLVSIPLATIRPQAKALIVDYISKNREKVLLGEGESAGDSQTFDPSKGLKGAFGQFKSLASRALIELANEKVSGQKGQRYPNEEQIVRDFLRQNPSLFSALGVKEGEIEDDDMLLYSRIVYELRREPGMQDAVKSGNTKTIQDIVNAAVDREIDMLCKQESRPGRPRQFIKPCNANESCRSYLTEGGRRRKTRAKKRTYRKRTVRKNKHR
jgi:hypothetical protein